LLYASQSLELRLLNAIEQQVVLYADKAIDGIINYFLLVHLK
jgi:hypothetical protein